MSTERRKRLLKILEIISSRAIHTQGELADALRAEGWDVTQSSVSRDIAALRLVKTGGVYQRPPSRAANSPDPDRRRVAEDVIGVEPAGEALIVLHTPAGEASAVGLALDRLAWGDVVGTIAGDDTIFVAVKDATARRRVIRELKKLIAAPAFG
jgi:transcriptional regulator of arginine metabolism